MRFIIGAAVGIAFVAAVRRAWRPFVVWAFARGDRIGGSCH